MKDGRERRKEDRREAVSTTFVPSDNLLTVPEEGRGYCSENVAVLACFKCHMWTLHPELWTVGLSLNFDLGLCTQKSSPAVYHNGAACAVLQSLQKLWQQLGALLPHGLTRIPVNWMLLDLSLLPPYIGLTEGGEKLIASWYGNDMRLEWEWEWVCHEINTHDLSC